MVDLKLIQELEKLFAKEHLGIGSGKILIDYNNGNITVNYVDDDLLTNYGSHEDNNLLDNFLYDINKEVNELHNQFNGDGDHNEN